MPPIARGVVGTVVKESFLCLARHIPLAGSVVDVFDCVARERMLITDRAAVADLEKRMTRMERGTREVQRQVLTEVLEELTQPTLAPEKLTAVLREFQEMRQSDYLVALFERLLVGNPNYEEMRRNPQSYGNLLQPGETLSDQAVPIFLDLGGVPRVLEVAPFALQHLLQAQTTSTLEAVGASSIWGLPEVAPARAATAPPSPELVEKLLVEAGRLRASGQGEVAMRLYARALESDPDNYEARIGRGVLCLEAKDYKRAVEEFKDAERIDPSRPASALGLAEVQFHRRQFNKAIRHYTQCLELDGKLAQAWCNRGLSYYYKKDYKKAFLDLTRAYDLDPDLLNIKKYLKLVRNKIEEA